MEDNLKTHTQSSSIVNRGNYCITNLQQSFPPSHWPLQPSQLAEFQYSWKRQVEILLDHLFHRSRPCQRWLAGSYALLSPTISLIFLLYQMYP